MLEENELLFNVLYEKTKNCNRDQFINLLMVKERENKNLKLKIKKLEDKLKAGLANNNEVLSARQYRTFDGPIPKKDLEKFPVLKNYVGQDVSYIVYESIEIL